MTNWHKSKVSAVSYFCLHALVFTAKLIMANRVGYVPECLDGWRNTSGDEFLPFNTKIHASRLGQIILTSCCAAMPMDITMLLI